MLEELPSMRCLRYRPHITFAIYDDYQPDILRDVFDSVFKSVKKTVVIFDELNFFETTDSLVLWANPIVTVDILEIHQRIHELLNVNSCRDHYRPENWVPHCSVAMSIPLNRKSEAMEFVDREFDSFEVVFDVADLVSFLPVQVDREMVLAQAN